MRTLLTKMFRTPRPQPATKAPLNFVTLEDRAVPAVFTFGTFAFDDANAPSTYSKLDPGTYDGAIVTALPSSATVAPVGFPNETGFPANLAIGSNIFGFSDVRPLNLPAGDNGAIARSGIQISYDNGRAIANAPGDDLLFYESASNASAVEAFMIQAYNVNTGTWGPWVWQAPETFQKYVGDPVQGAFATNFDLSDLGVPDGNFVTKFRVVNMMPQDRMVDASGFGVVIPNNTDPGNTFLPNAGPLGGNLPLSSNGDFDPDPLYTGAIGAVATNIANIRTTVTAVPSPGIGGAQVTYTVTIENLGSLNVTGVSPVFTLDPDFTPTMTTSVAAGGATGNTGSPNTDILAIPASGSVTYTIVGDVAPGAASPLVSTFDSGLPAPPAIDPNPADNMATSTLPLVTSGNLVVTIMPGDGNAAAGSPITYTITVTNTGPSNLNGAGITDVIPPGLMGVTYTSTATGATGNTTSGSGAINDTVNIQNGGIITYVVTGTIDPNFSGNIPFTASTTLPPGATGTAGSKTVNTNAVLTGDLFVTMSADPSMPISGGMVTYTIVAGNTGPSTATGSLLTDSFSAAFTNVTFTSVATGGATGNTNGLGDLNESLTLPAGGQVTYTVVATLNPTTVGPITNTATLNAPANFTDTTPGNNSKTVQVNVIPGADIGLVVTPNTPIVSVGGKMSYVVDIVNNGPSAVAGVKVASLLDPNILGVTFTSTASNGASGNTTVGAGDYNDLLTLPQGGKVTYTIFGTVMTGITGNLNSTFTTMNPTGIPDPGGDNSVTITTPTQPSADVIYAASTGFDVITQVFVFNADGTQRFSYQPYDSAFTRGVNVAIGDVNGDGFPDVITGTSTGGGSHVRAVNGLDGANLFSFFAYGPDVRTGVVVATADINNDGISEIITGSDAGGGPRIRVFDITQGGASGNSVLDFFAFDPTMNKGVRVASGNTTGTPIPEIIVSAGPGGPSVVRIFNGVNGAFVNEFQPFGNSTRGSYVAAADFDDSGFVEIVVGDERPSTPTVAVYDPQQNFALTVSFLAYESEFRGGVRVATYADDSVNPANPPNRILTGPGIGGGPRLRKFTGTGIDLGSQFLIGDFERGGIYVG